ncbi:hypothetical protein LRS05_13480 [Flavobacterium sp. J372]|uniref:DUF6712 family protein n=1 Tax=Flavobacterium sp. J372 TaxID=2898436 RepID=UPI002150A270|nr:hypothetical protein [Flavobacterium sp. J372]MCR5863076.1 hypothetical protein [Flavobacterium sp. J372]
MQPLITRDDIVKYRQIAKSLNNDKLNESILEAQLLDLKPLLGERLFDNIIALPEDYTELLDGGVYTHDGIEYSNYGLKMALAYFAYARYVMFSHATDTPYAFVEKRNTDSQPVTSETKKSLFTTNREIAGKVWNNVRMYLQRTNYADYTTCAVRPAIRFTKIQ